jgi:hypothetical protein
MAFIAPELIIDRTLARERLNNRADTGQFKKDKIHPLCLSCGEPATNELPSCNKPKCVKAVRPVFRWAQRVAAATLTKAVKPRPVIVRTRQQRRHNDS